MDQLQRIPKYTRGIQTPEALENKYKVIVVNSTKKKADTLVKEVIKKIFKS